MAEFKLHERLQADTIFLIDWPLSQVLLMNDKNYPWLILVPRRDDISEIFNLSDKDQAQLMREISAAAKIIEQEFGADKVNIGALGNIVSQLHIHVIARFKNDISWPNAVWGSAKPVVYADEQLSLLIAKLQIKLTAIFA